jgi:hypothetical protein
MARRGVTVTMDQMATVTDAQSFDAMIRNALETR